MPPRSIRRHPAGLRLSRAGRALAGALFALGLCAALPTRAADPFPDADPKAGPALLAKSCNACHVSLQGGDGSGIYTRPDRKISNARELFARVRICNTNVGAGWFEDEEKNVAAYLNQRYYHFQ